MVYSDGFKKAFRIIKKLKSFRNLSTTRKRKLLNQEENYNQKQFKNFLEWDEIELSIGEEKEKLFDLIQSFFEAEIIIFGTQEKMIPKLVSAYCNSDNMPLLINLYRKKLPNIEYLGIVHSSNRVIFVDIDNYDIEKIVNRIIVYLKSKNKI